MGFTSSSSMVGSSMVGSRIVGSSMVGEMEEIILYHI